MRRIALMLSTLIIAGAYLAGSVTAQTPSVFRYASEPFSEDAPADELDAGAEEGAAVADPEGREESSYDSYASWPKGSKNLVQRKAIYRAEQRELRIAARQWYGYSASRPPVYGNPYYMDVYAPALWSTSAYAQQSLHGPFGWYFPRRSLSAHRWASYAYAARLAP